MTEDELLSAYGVDRSRLHRGGQYRTTTLRLIIARDGATCARCGRWVDVDLSGLHPHGPTLGHRVAVGAGGTDAIDNLQLEHRVCNLNAAPSVGDAEPRIAQPFTVRRSDG